MKQPSHLGIALLSLLLLSACGSASAPANVESTGVAAGPPAATVSFLDGDVVHEMTIEMDDDEYATAIAAYETDESKEWIHATVTIDGDTYDDAGIRLKGNSSLFSLRSDNRGGPESDADADAPESLPWLIRLDKYVDGQSHNGISDFVVRSNNTETALNEAVALDLLELTGLAYQDSVYASFSVDGSEPVLRLVMENPDDIWMANGFTDPGILYKAEATGNYSYRGDDPEAYDEVFDVEAGDEDLTPLIEFLDFLNNSDDTAFYSDLDQWLDTDSFATYLAFQNIIANNDDIDGRGNNSYLYYDSQTGQFTVVAWDHNLAFGAAGAAGAAGDLPGGGPGRPNGDRPLPDAGAPGEATTERQPLAPGGGPGDRAVADTSNILVERFLADDDYTATYRGELERLTDELYESGAAAAVLDSWAHLLETSELATSTTIADEAADIERFFG